MMRYVDLSSPDIVSAEMTPAETARVVGPVIGGVLAGLVASAVGT